MMNTLIHKAIFTDPQGWVDEKTSKEKWSTAARLTLNDGQDSLNPVGLQSGLTGSGFDTLIIDDPYADQKEAFSETTRNNLQEFWDFTVMSRMGTYTNVFGMFHRYHVEDLAGYLLDKGSFDYWRYATICDGPYIHEETGQKFDDPLGRKTGEYISPLRRPPEYYDEVKKNKRVFSSMFQGRPSAEEGEFFNVSQLQEPTITKQDCSVLIRSWDIAATQDGGDYSVGVLIGMTPDKRVRIFDIERAQVDSAGRDRLQLATAQKDGPNVLITIPQDPGAAGKTQVFHVQQNLQGFQVATRATSGSKEDRARALASAVNIGHVEIDESIRFFKDLRREFRDFPLSDHDDIVDATADGYNECFERVSRGLVIKNFAHSKHLVTWDRFDTNFGTLIPRAWTVYAGVKITPEVNVPNSAVIVARASESSEMREVLFVVGEYKEYTDDMYTLFDWLNTTLDSVCEQADTTVIYLHPKSKVHLPTITQKVKCKVQMFDGDELAGLTEANWYLLDGEDNVFGNSRLYGIVADDQLSVATDSHGLKHLRQEAVTWGYTDKQVPSAIGHVWDCLRMVTYSFRTKMQRLSAPEKHDREMADKGLGYDVIEKLSGYDQLALAQARAIADRAFMNKQKQSKQTVNPFRRRG
jgi:predicted phage terminase large subunit-like protein